MVLQSAMPHNPQCRGGYCHRTDGPVASVRVSGHLHLLLCDACAKACDTCGEACEKFPDDKHMASCAKACRDCAKACREMTKHAAHHD